MPDLIDIGVNLAHDSFDADRDDVIRRAAENGVGRLIVTGTSVTASARAIELCTAHQCLFATAGIHPHNADELDEHSIDALRALLESPHTVAVGECGLDYYRDFAPRDRQQAAFVAQLSLAAEAQLPVFLHQRDAHADFIAVLRETRARLVGGVAHCFTGGQRELRDCLDLDLYIGITGWVCDERRGRELQTALPELPLDRLLLETDAPYLLPRDLHPSPKGRRNEPMFLRHVLERVATLLNRSPESVAEAATQNAEQLFDLPRNVQPKLL